VVQVGKGRLDLESGHFATFFHQLEEAINQPGGQSEVTQSVENQPVLIAESHKYLGC